jgi:hypothetical protein
MTTAPFFLYGCWIRKADRYGLRFRSAKLATGGAMALSVAAAAIRTLDRP